jgi:hypothetical protein
MISLDRSSLMPVDTIGTGCFAAVSKSGRLVSTSYGEIYWDSSPPLSLHLILHRILSPSAVGYSSVTAKNSHPGMVSPGGMLVWMLWSSVAIFKSKAFARSPYIQYTRPPSAGMSLHESHLCPFFWTLNSSRSIYTGVVRGFLIVIYKAADAGDRVSPNPDTYLNQNTPRLGFLEPSKTLNRRENANSGSLDSFVYRITVAARIQRNNVPDKAKVNAAALTCVEVIIATIRVISNNKKATPEFCTQPLESA